MSFRDQRYRRIACPFIAADPFKAGSAGRKFASYNVGPRSNDLAADRSLPDAALDFGSQPLPFLQVSLVRAIDEAERFQVQERIAEGLAPDHQPPNRLAQFVDDIDGLTAEIVLHSAIEIACDVRGIRPTQEGGQLFMRMPFGDPWLAQTLEQSARVVDLQGRIAMPAVVIRSDLEKRNRIVMLPPPSTPAGSVPACVRPLRRQHGQDAGR